ncbi:tRNA (guanine-N(7)-)-methyltransferase [Alteromonas sp. ASW11-19]|uniref:tRNA (guanine(46)-N(7))-methyltransferase n=1 Tax=Alteromonas salexigens TaxID=2982530 RepID=A0ABT2VML3_9ALTE|nr:tRNA (guanine-N(7)-)-methyltransferase [Alteromonas salexigens]MCU7554553.1 tRNA (guanine-N(7)-)-methyltransferase [Alteromonas salexigens]
MSGEGGNSRSITTNQTGIHEKLDELVLRYQQAENKKPIGAHTQAAFDEACAWLGDYRGPLILDSCCGVGESTARLAEQFPDYRILGLDKSAQRVDKHTSYAAGCDNYRVIRADVNDFWRLLRQSDWTVARHYLLYPNPYPKRAHIQKRWYACAAMADLMALCPYVEVRSNWPLYLMEFAQASAHYGLASTLSEVRDDDAFTPFERKYQRSGQTCWKLTCQPEESE